ncbi:MAG: hypothetical protein LBD80_02975 [Tannerella sp.]|jgi:hypothetical protein|nr:hypothetical protein [Tannerella sp.]
MKSKIIKTGMLLFIAFITTSYTTECDIVGFYKGIDVSSGTKCLTTSDDLKDVETILVPTKIDKGKYTVSMTRKAANLYKIDDTDLYVETRYCHKYTTREDVVLIVESNFGYSRGKIIF